MKPAKAETEVAISQRMVEAGASRAGGIRPPGGTDVLGRAFGAADIPRNARGRGAQRPGSPSEGPWYDRIRDWRTCTWCENTGRVTPQVRSAWLHARKAVAKALAAQDAYRRATLWEGR